MAPPRIPLLFAALLLISRTASALQVTPNSPCAAVCQDQSQFDVSAPKSSNTKNSDINCKDVYHNGPAESKWKTCMTCLQTSTFSQGSENDMMWFMYNLRYSLAYCVFAYPNATEAGSTPCSTIMACGPLKDAFTHGITDQKDMTTFSYCAVPGAMDAPHYDRCVSCVGAEGKTEILANSVIALEAGCLQQPAIGGILGLNDSIFAPTTIKIVDPLTLVKDSEDKGLPGGTIAGIVGGALAVLVIVSAISFVCYRKRKNRRARADFEAGRNSRFRHRHQSSMSFQCQTHAMSPRFWPGGDEAATPVNDKTDTMPQQPGDAGRRSSLWKPHNSMSSFENTLDTRSEKTWTNSPYQEDLMESSDSISQQKQQHKKTALATSTPLHHITTSIPSMPRNAHMSPNAYHSPADIRTPMSAESTRSTSALLPGIKPYVPADHGVHFTHQAPTPPVPGLSAFSSPASASPLLKSYGWPDQRQQQQQQQQAAAARSRLSTATTGTGAGIGLAISSVPPPVPPPAVPWINAPGKKMQKKNGTAGPGTPVESWEVKTSFDLPPPPKR
ncbi:hypothetical protein QBC39DRAFT_48582 [Podospora conica]|nr:hypothetical protein QBC39DRAFT_48582 [Schizothecium conicum]